MILDPVVIANAAAAVICAAIAAVTWRRRAHNLTFAMALTFVMVGGCWWSVALAVVVGSTTQTVAAVATLLTFPGPSVLVAAFMGLGLSIARPQWAPRRWMLVALLVEPALITLAGRTNPWHLLVYRGAGAAQLTGSGTTMDELFHAADLAMYQARNAGRNVVRQALDRALFTVADAAVGSAVPLRPDRRVDEIHQLEAH